MVAALQEVWVGAMEVWVGEAYSGGQLQVFMLVQGAKDQESLLPPVVWEVTVVTTVEVVEAEALVIACQEEEEVQASVEASVEVI